MTAKPPPPKTAPRPRGRPEMPPELRRAERMHWRTTPQRKARAQALADAAGLTLSAWLDRLVDRAR